MKTSTRSVYIKTEVKKHYTKTMNAAWNEACIS